MNKLYDELTDINVDLEVIQIAQRGVTRTSLGTQVDILEGNPDLNEAWAVSELVTDKIEKVRKKLDGILDNLEEELRSK